MEEVDIVNDYEWKCFTNIRSKILEVDEFCHSIVKVMNFGKPLDMSINKLLEALTLNRVLFTSFDRNNLTKNFLKGSDLDVKYQKFSKNLHGGRFLLKTLENSLNKKNLIIKELSSKNLELKEEINQRVSVVEEPVAEELKNSKEENSYSYLDHIDHQIVNDVNKTGVTKSIDLNLLNMKINKELEYKNILEKREMNQEALCLIENGRESVLEKIQEDINNKQEPAQIPESTQNQKREPTIERDGERENKSKDNPKRGEVGLYSKKYRSKLKKYAENKTPHQHFKYNPSKNCDVYELDIPTCRTKDFDLLKNTLIVKDTFDQRILIKNMREKYRNSQNYKIMDFVFRYYSNRFFVVPELKTVRLVYCLSKAFGEEKWVKFIFNQRYYMGSDGYVYEYLGRDFVRSKTDNNKYRVWILKDDKESIDLIEKYYIKLYDDDYYSKDLEKYLLRSVEKNWLKKYGHISNDEDYQIFKEKICRQSCEDFRNYYDNTKVHDMQFRKRKSSRSPDRGCKCRKYFN